METLCFKKPLRLKPLLLAVMLVFRVETVLVDEDEWVMQDSNSPAVDNETNEESLPEPSTQPASVQPQPTWDPWIDPLAEANIDTYAGTDASAAATTTEPAARVHCSEVAVTKPCERVCGAQGATTTTESGCDKMPTLSIRADGGKVQSGDYAAIHGLLGVSTMSWNAADGSGSKGAAAIAKGNGSD